MLNTQRCLLLFVAAAVTIPAVRAQQTPADSPGAELRTLPKRFFSDELQIWSSPFRPTKDRAHTIKKYVIPFTILTAALIASDRKTADLLPNTPDQDKWSGRVSQIGASYTIAGIGGATYLLGRFAHNDRAREAGLLGLEALGHAQIAVFALKQATNGERPVEHDGRGGFWEGGDSFPSGHAASSFALATVYAYEYRDHIAVPITAYSLAGLVSASRLGAQRHWVSDIVVGGSIGFLIGRFTYKRNHDPSLPGSPISRIDRVIPQVGIGGGGVLLSWHL
jgi:membrane-associated phospholipid phosphatase